MQNEKSEESEHLIECEWDCFKATVLKLVVGDLAIIVYMRSVHEAQNQFCH